MIAVILLLRKKVSSSENLSGKIPAVVGGRNSPIDFSLEFANRVLRLSDCGLQCQNDAQDSATCYYFCLKWERRFLLLRIVAGLLLVAWITLVLIGKGGFIHLFLLGFLGVAAVEVMTIVRGRLIR
ncbi:MAG: hypothetical protein ACKVQW_00160 [Pyrinomonadaceae bacterium]